MTRIRIIGIDPAPSKPNTVFDGERFQFFDAFELKDFLKKENASDDKVLVCWDAPLMKLSDEQLRDLAHKGGTPFHSRGVDDTLNERFPTNEKSDVSVRPYAGCPHWAVSKYCLGLPQLGGLDKSYTPFPLMTKNEDRNSLGKGVVEVHPALGLYCWDREVYMDHYHKGQKQEMDRLVGEFFGEGKVKKAYEKGLKDKEGKGLEADDLVDAALAYFLGKAWFEDEGIQLYGGKQEGALLLPQGAEDFLQDLRRA